MQDNEIKQVEKAIEEVLIKMQNHDISAALEELLQVVEIEPENVKIINLIASCYFIKGEFDRALSSWELVLRLDEANKDADIKLKAASSPAFKAWLKRYREVMAGMASRNYQQAVTELRHLMEEHDGFVSLYELLGLCYLALSEPDRARSVWEKGLELDRSSKALLGYLEAKKEKQPEVRRLTNVGSREMAAARQRHGSPYYGLAWATAGVLCLALLIPLSYYVDKVQFDGINPQAIQKKIMKPILSIRQSEEPTPAIAPVYRDMELSANAGGVDKAAVLEVQTDANNNEQEEEVFYNQGLNAYMRADWEEAAGKLGTVVSMQSGSYLNREALYYLARTKYLGGDLDSAREYYGKYLVEFPDSNYYDDSLYYLGIICHRNGDDEGARQFFARLKEFEPGSGYVSTAIFKEIMQ